MNRLLKYRVLIAGAISPFAAVLFYMVCYSTLTAISANVEQDWLFRLSSSAVAMTLPFVITIFLAIRERQQRGLSLSGKIGIGLAILSLCLVWKPVHDGILRTRQTHNMAMRDVPAPRFSTVDISGNPQSLEDHEGDVVLVNIWATWCQPCREEMPKLDRMYREQKHRGFMVFGMSDEDPGTQRKFVEKVPVTYPLLTVRGEVPSLYRDIAKYPAIFLIDRKGRLQPAPTPEQGFEALEDAVDVLLRSRDQQ